MEKTVFIFLPNNPIEAVIFLGRITLPLFGKVFITSKPKCVYFMEKFPILGHMIKNRFRLYDKYIGDYKGLWYEIEGQAISITNKWYSENKNRMQDNERYLNKCFATKKFEAFIKKRILRHVLSILRSMHLAYKYEGQCIALLKDDAINRYVVKETLEKFGSIEVKYICVYTNFIVAVEYIFWLLKEFIRRGVAWNKETPYFKILTEVCAELHRKVLKADILVDNQCFSRDDILFCCYAVKDKLRKDQFTKVADKGYHTFCVPDARFNIKKNFIEILHLYFLVPLSLYIRLIRIRIHYLFPYYVDFFKEGFPVEVIMSNFRIGCNISYINYDDIARTIVFNRFGIKNVLYHWTDLTVFPTSQYAFIAHDIYFVWGNIHYDYNCNNYYVDKKIIIGCIFKKAYNENILRRDVIMGRIKGLKTKLKIVSFYDTTFDNYLQYTEEFYLDYLELIERFLRNRKDVNVLFKSKKIFFERIKLSSVNQPKFRALFSSLMRYDNFIPLDPYNWSAEDVVAISDVCISQGLTTPATIALICGKNAFYFDNTGNNYHPLAQKYKDIIVFDDSELICRQIDYVLNGEFSCSQVISKQDLRAYDAFSDDNAFERLRNNLYELTQYD